MNVQYTPSKSKHNKGNRNERMRTKNNSNNNNSNSKDREKAKCDNDDYNCNGKLEYNAVKFYCCNKLHATLGRMWFISREPKYAVKQRHDIKMAPMCLVTDIESMDATLPKQAFNVLRNPIQDTILYSA